MNQALLKFVQPRSCDADTARFLLWFAEREFDAPDFEWSALTVLVFAFGGGGAFGRSGYYYDVTGRWSPANAVRQEVELEERRRAYSDWITSTSRALGREWQAALVQVVRRADAFEVAIEFAFDDPEYFFQESRLNGDAFRPASLPIPLGSGLRED